MFDEILRLILFGGVIVSVDFTCPANFDISFSYKNLKCGVQVEDGCNVCFHIFNMFDIANVGTDFVFLDSSFVDEFNELCVDICGVVKEYYEKYAIKE